MRTAKWKIEKDFFDKLMAAGDGERSAMFEKTLPDWVTWGYGYYGLVGLTEEDGVCYVKFRMGSTCD